MQSAANIVLIADPRVVAIPIRETHEPLVDMRQSPLVIGPSPEIENNIHYTFVRKSVADRLLAAQAALPREFRLCLAEGLRSLDVQKMLFDTRQNMLRQNNPDWTPEHVFIETMRMLSPLVTVSGETNIPAHATGAAVDVYLVDAQTQQPVDMGIFVADWAQDETGILSQTDTTELSATGRKNRDIMGAALTDAGFANYPAEYWHWSYGDRYWAFVTGAPHALFGSDVSLP